MYKIKLIFETDFKVFHQINEKANVIEQLD